MRKNRKIIIAACIVVLAALVYDLFYFGGNIRFYAKWIECGRRPLVAHARPGFQWYDESPTFALWRTQVWFCTPGEAERAGYSSDSRRWQRDNLDEE